MSRSLRPNRPPPPVPKPGHVKVVRTMYKYDAQQADELSFDEGELLYITDMSNTDWWRARCGKRSGLIPSNYVGENTETIDCPMHEAAKRGNVSFLNECLDNQVSVNSLDKAGSTPLHWAAHGGHIECMQILLNKPHCEVSVQNKLGDTPIHSAAWKGHADAVDLLLEKGAQVNIRNKDGKLPYELAKDPDTAGKLRLAAGMPRALSGDYGDEEDSD
ncbi:osteoclast-stimulating factor 1-like [Mercenaria mercenaria]|uniref:osteoclast-stimulating factor 1-like n=1 Tax=Mercenaria mercenaria TaxID=6596 RepID=UPI001E1D9D2B|nr:osteoclast-stimulating factor 1-like [Mercenaria mercenaria]